METFLFAVTTQDCGWPIRTADNADTNNIILRFRRKVICYRSDF